MYILYIHTHMYVCARVFAREYKPYILLNHMEWHDATSDKWHDIT